MTHIYDYFHDAFGAEPFPSTKQCVKLKNMKKAEPNWEEDPLPLLFLFLTVRVCECVCVYVESPLSLSLFLFYLFYRPFGVVPHSDIPFWAGTILELCEQLCAKLSFLCLEN